jgi:ubiquinone/menaquinone biosynthesis C-methylase UbiE
MSWLELPRVPEPEVMDDSDEVEAYSSAAAQAHLDKIDDTFVEHAARLVSGRTRGRALDIGTGPGQIVLKLARRLLGWQFAGVDRSPNMIRQAREAARVVLAGERNARPPSETFAAHSAPENRLVVMPESAPQRPPKAVTLAPASRVEFFVADGSRLPFPGASFDLVMCNSVLHHLADPQRLFAEIARLAKPGGAILVRDLRRPSRLAFPLHVRWHGRHYSGLMYKLYCASVHSAYTAQELEGMLRGSPLGAASANGRTRVFTHARTHLGLERPMGS